MPFGVLSSLCNYEVTRRIREIILGVNPTYIPGCFLWLDAADTSTILSSGQNVTQWNDKSGFGYNFTAYNNPKTGTTTINGLNVIDTSIIDNSNNYFYNSSYVSPSKFTIFAVTYRNTNTITSRLFSGPNELNFVLGNAGLYYASFLGTNAGWNDGYTGPNLPNFTICNNTTNILEITTDGTTLYPYVNGNAQNSRGGQNTNFVGLYIGNSEFKDNNWPGYIAEIIIYNNVLPTGARQLIEGYLAAKWGLQSQLPTTHPYYSAQPNMYFPQLPLWWYKFLASDISYSSPTSSFVAYNYGTLQYDGSMNGWAVTGPTDGLAIDNAANLGVEPSSLRFGNGTPYMTTTSSNTQWIQWPSISSVSNYYTLAYVLKYADTTAPARWQQHWTMNSATNYNNPNGLTVTNYYNSGTSLVWWNAPNSIFNMANVLDGNPHHFTFIFGPSNFQPQIYLDASALLVPSSLTGPYNTITSNILGFNYCNWNNQFINAWLGETRLYNFAMTPTQVNTLYNLMMDYTVPQPPITITGVTAVAGNVYSTGTSTTNGVQYAVYAFTSSTTNPAAPQYTINYNCSTATQCFVLAVAGGGGGGQTVGGGGGGGGVVMMPVSISTGLGSITVSVGEGGVGNNVGTAANGYNSVVTFTNGNPSNITAYGGGGGGGQSGPSFFPPGGGSGVGSCGGAGNFASTIDVSNSNFNYANKSINFNAIGIDGTSGGGGAGTTSGTASQFFGSFYAASGGRGIQCFLPGIKDFTITSNITNSSYLVSNLFWGGGGGASAQNGRGGNGGIGGGGAGSCYNSGVSGSGGIGLNGGGTATQTTGGNGGKNTGGGGGGVWSGASGAGGSGIVIIAFPQTAPVTAPTNSVLTNPNLSTSAYNSICGAFACNLVNYNYYGPMMTLRYSTDLSGNYIANFYADTYGNMGTGYLGTGTSLSSWINNQFNIQNINGCVIWLDAASSSSITTISNKVSQWVDKTSNAFTFTQSTDSNRPTYVANSLNGLPTLQFTASNSTFLGGPTNFAVGTNSFSLFAVCKFNDTVTAGSIFSKSRFSGGTGRILMIRDLNDISLNILVTDSTNTNQKIKETYPGNTYRILELVYNRSAGTSNVYNNGTLISSNVSTDTSNLTNTYNMIIGGYNDGNGNIITPQPGLYLDGNIAEIVAFSNPYDMSDGTRQQIEGYLASKWGLKSMLPANHPALNTSYAYVTKWYDQGMDFSFNCATQYNTSQQPIYDVSFKLLNFGYQGSGGGVVAPQTNCYFNLPDYTFPTGDGSYTTILKNYNMPISTSTDNYFYSGGEKSLYKLNALAYIYNAGMGGYMYYNPWFVNDLKINISPTPTFVPNTVLVNSYVSGSLGARYLYINDVSYSGQPTVSARAQTGILNYIGTYTTSSGFGNHQMYYFYIFGTALSDQDRTIVENVNYYNSINNIISDTNLIMYYPMESGDISNGYLANWAFGSPIYDASMVNSPTLTSNSRAVGGYAMSFSATSSQYLKLPDFTPTTNGLSFSVWYNSVNTGSWGRIFDFGITPGVSNYYNILITSNNTANQLSCITSDKYNNYTTLVISGNGNDSTWRHVVWTLTYANPSTNTSTWIVYINGQYNTSTVAGYYPDPSITRTLNYIAKSSVIGDASYNGYIDDFRVYNRVLSAAEVSQLYYAQGWNYIPKQIQTIKNSISTVSTYLLTMYYPMEPTDINGTYLANWALGTPIYDASLVNAPTLSTNSRIVGGSSMQFTAASSQYLQLSNFTPTNNGLSFSVWINVNGSTGDHSRIFDFGVGQSNSNILIKLLSSNILEFHCYYSTNQNNITSITVPQSYTNNWVHIVWILPYVAPGSQTSNWIIYSNGSIAGRSSNGYYPDPSVTRTTNYIGKSNWNEPYYNGYIDDFRVYNRVLTPTEVQTLYYTQGSNYIPQYVNLYYNSVSTISTTGLVMYYPLESTDTSGGYLANWALGTPIYDASMVNSPTTSTDMKVVGSSAMRFTASSSQYVRLPNFTPTTNGLTFSVWYNSMNTGSWGRIFDFGNGANLYNIVLSPTAITTNKLNLTVYGNSPTINYTQQILPDPSYNDGIWRHIVWTLTYDVSYNPGSTWKVYINGLINQTYLSCFYPDTSVTRTINYIGKSNWDGDAYYNGYIDDFRVYNRVLSAAEVQTLYAAQGANYIPQYVNLYYNSISVVSTTGLVMYYPMELTDSSYGYLANWAFNFPIYDAQIVNSPTYSADMKVAGTAAMQFTASSSQYLRLPSFTPTTNGLSFSVWYNVNGSTGISSRIFDFGIGESNNNIIVSYHDSTHMYFYTFYDTTGQIFDLPTPNSTNNWIHIAWTLPYVIPGSKTCQSSIYVNGVFTSNFTTYYPNPSITRTTNYIGKSNYVVDQSFNGFIDDFRVYNRVLTASEVQTLYNSQGANYIPQQIYNSSIRYTVFGGTVTTNSGYTVISYTNNATGILNFTSITTATTVYYLVVGGGASGGSGSGGGGGGGAVTYGSFVLNSATNLSITVGNGGSSVSGGIRGDSGGYSSISGIGINTIIAGGGSGGGGYNDKSNLNITTAYGGSGGGTAAVGGNILATSVSANPNTYFNLGGIDFSVTGFTSDQTTIAAGGGGAGSIGGNAITISSSPEQYSGGSGGAGLRYSSLNGYNIAINNILSTLPGYGSGAAAGYLGAGGGGGGAVYGLYNNPAGVGGSNGAGGAGSTYGGNPGGAATVYGGGGGGNGWGASGASGAGYQGVVFIAF